MLGDASRYYCPQGSFSGEGRRTNEKEEKFYNVRQNKISVKLRYKYCAIKTDQKKSNTF